MDPARYYGPYRVVETSTSLAGLSAKQVAGENYSRVALMLCSGSNVTFNVSTLSSVTTTSGIVIAAANPTPLLIDWYSWGVLVGQAWFGISGGAGVCTAIEVIQTYDENSPLGDMESALYGNSQPAIKNGGAYQRGNRPADSRRPSYTDLLRPASQRLRNFLERQRSPWRWNPDTGWVQSADPDAP